MASRSPEERMVVVRLSQVPEPKRVAAADRIIRAEDLERVHPEEAILLRMAALFPREDPELEVPESLARRVCAERRGRR
jgi:hypothetical protein